MITVGSSRFAATSGSSRGMKFCGFTSPVFKVRFFMNMRNQGRVAVGSVSTPITAMRPPGRVIMAACVIRSARPTASIVASAPRPSVHSSTFSPRFCFDGFTASQPSWRARSSRPSSRSTAITRAAPRRIALICANVPTGPQPNTTTVSPGPTSAISAPM